MQCLSTNFSERFFSGLSHLLSLLLHCFCDGFRKRYLFTSKHVFLDLSDSNSMISGHKSCRFDEPFTGFCSGLSFNFTLIVDVHLLLVAHTLPGMLLRCVAAKLYLLLECLIAELAFDHIRRSCFCLLNNRPFGLFLFLLDDTGSNNFGLNYFHLLCVLTYS